MTYTPLPIIQVGVEELQLDLDNYRIPTHRDDQAAALSYLFASEDVLGAARLILRNGYFDNEVPIVIAEGNGYIVLEGNRRVSALQVLRKPGLLPEHEAEIRALVRRYALEAEDLPAKIRVLVAPDRDVAAPHIARLHTGLSKKPWSRDQQATYYYSLLGPHVTVDDIKARYPDVEVVRFIKMAMMRRFLAGVRFSDHSLHEYVTGSSLSMSAFEYAYRRNDIAQAIGVAFDRDGHLLPANSIPEKIGEGLPVKQRSALEFLMVEFRAGRLNTRSAEFRAESEKHTELVARLNGTSDAGPGRPQEQSPPGPVQPAKPFDEDSTTSAPFETSDGRSAPSAEPAAPVPDIGARGPNHPDTRETLQLSGVDYTTHTSENLQLRYHELRRLSVVKFPAAAAMLLRSVLETTIKFHFESTQTPASGELSSSFAILDTAYGSEKPIRNQVGRIKSGSAGLPGSIQWFNVVSHSADAVVTPDQVREAWRLVNPVLRRLLRPAAFGAPV